MIGYPVLDRRMNRRVMDDVCVWASAVDEKDLSEASWEWSFHEYDLVGFPENVGELQAMLQTAFEAGRMYQFRLARAGNLAEEET